MKKVLSILLIITLTMTCSLVSHADTPLLGDVNGDAQIDAKDALLVLQSAVDKVDLTEPQLVAAKVVGEEVPSAKDALCILQKAVNIIRHFPTEITSIDYVKWAVTDIDPEKEFSKPRNLNYKRISSPSSTDPTFVTLCQNKEDLVTALKDSYGLTESAQAEMSAKFGEDYFTTRSLLLFNVTTPAQDTEVILKNLYAVQDQLYLDLIYWGVNAGGWAIQSRVYWVELAQTDLPAHTVHIQTDHYAAAVGGRIHNFETVNETVPIV